MTFLISWLSMDVFPFSVEYRCELKIICLRSMENNTKSLTYLLSQTLWSFKFHLYSQTYNFYFTSGVARSVWPEEFGSERARLMLRIQPHDCFVVETLGSPSLSGQA